MMSNKKSGCEAHSISPVLFLTVEGEPMHFFLRPGPTKVELQPLIKAGGGLLCSAQQPGAILLAEAEEMASITTTAAHWYVLTQYIRDCVEKNIQLDVEDYRFKPENVPRQKPSTHPLKGRLAYTPDEDEAILSYISSRKKKIQGDGVWKEMEKKNVTAHSWQSMKYRYKMKLADREMDRTGVDEKLVLSLNRGRVELQDAENQDTCIQNASTAQNDSSPETSSLEVLEVQVDAEPMLAEQTLLETSEPQPTGSSMLNIIPEDPPAAQPESLLQAPFSRKRKEEEEEKAFSSQKQPNCRSARRQLQLEDLPSDQPPASSSPDPHKDTSSPQATRNIKSTGQHARQPGPSTVQPPSKRARKEVRKEGIDDRQEETEQPTTSDVQDNVVMLKEAGKKKKIKLGILQMAAVEFEDESKSDCNMFQELSEATISQSEEETAAEQPRHTQTPVRNALAATTFPTPVSGPSRGRKPEDQASGKDPPLPESNCPVPSEPVPSTSKAHLFIFEDESQEGSRLIPRNSKPASTADEPIRRKDKEVSLTQVHLEEDKERIRCLMKQANQDLVSVTKALLKTSGDFSAALRLLLAPSSITGPFWNHRDDNLLLSADSQARQELQEKYGVESLAKRLIFLEVE